MSNLTTPQRKTSSASGHPGDLPEQVTPRGSKRELEDDEGESDVDDESKPEKRAGRRKIKIEYIDDKSRRHITFSKRKAGIMKKAYELSTLTGTQVLLLVVSETGLVYTFTTPKLQPLVTKPEGKNLIQACLNAPDPQTSEAAPSRPPQTPPVYGNDTPPVDGNNDNLYNNNNEERKHQSSGGPIPNYVPANTLGNLGFGGQYNMPNNLPMNTSGLSSNYIPAQYPPQHGQQYLQYGPNSSPYMPSGNYWAGGQNGNPNGNGKVQQFPNQSPEKK
ncbi:hypothetical protein G9A89_017369 [Geosiphon pyriformis]|nr:hypothetical protein G9A89_017369 [Geosiphon pyriformis]